MRKGRKHVVYAWVVLLLFCTGQYMAFAHTHPRQEWLSGHTKSTAKTILKERCDVCDVMHHSYVLSKSLVFGQQVALFITFYIQPEHDFTPIQLLLSVGRAPPKVC